MLCVKDYRADMCNLERDPAFLTYNNWHSYLLVTRAPIPYRNLILNRESAEDVVNLPAQGNSVGGRSGFGCDHGNGAVHFMLSDLDFD